MDLHGFDLNLLVALDALLAEKSVTNAGRRVHLSQSAMSGVLARLRHALNDKLLVASRGGMTLTPLAESLVGPVRAILEQVHRTIIVNVPFDPATSRRVFTIAASDYAVTVLLTDALRRVSRDAPGVGRAMDAYAKRTGRDATHAFAIGDADAILARVAEYVDAGVSKFILRPLGGDDDAILAQTRLLIEQVLPRAGTRWPRRPKTSDR